ncbi:MAG: hypothetical protein RQ754_09750 [Desulfuromonadales bacterium]|jgi:hypothetical protein|nr:hypothetical protein [Desulfuromonadales bacterium]
MSKRTALITLTILLPAAGIVSYNYWSLSCGRCTVSAFYGMSPPALVLLLCNMVALAVFYGFRLIRHKRVESQFCACGNLLHRNWQYCPCCGTLRRQSTPS